MPAGQAAKAPHRKIYYKCDVLQNAVKEWVECFEAGFFDIGAEPIKMVCRRNPDQRNENGTGRQTDYFGSGAIHLRLYATTVRLKTPVNRADCDCQAYSVTVFVEKEPIKWAFFRKVKGSKSVEWCTGWPVGAAAF